MAKFKVQNRAVVGKKVKSLRKQGLVPAAMFGPKFPSQNVAVAEVEFTKLFAQVGSSKLVDIEMEDGSDEKVLIKEVQYNPVTDETLHINMYVIDRNTPISAEIPVVITGMSPAVDMGLGFLVESLDSVHIRCLPANLPAQFEVNVDSLVEVGNSIAVADLKLPEGVELDSSVDHTTAIVYVSGAQKLEELDETPAEGEAVEGEEGAEGEAAATEGESKEEEKE